MDMTTLQIILAVAGGVAIRWAFEKILDFIAIGGKSSQENNGYVDAMTASEVTRREAFERHVIEVLAKLSVTLDEASRRIDNIKKG